VGIVKEPVETVIASTFDAVPEVSAAKDRGTHRVKTIASRRSNDFIEISLSVEKRDRRRIKL
jgi:hypothetical protein